MTFQLLSFSISECEEYSNLSRINPYPSFGLVGGSTTDISEFPHMSAVGTRQGNKIIWSCGGSLISENFVVSAAHCSPGQANAQSLVVRVGDKNLQRDDDGAKPQEFEVRSIFVHPDYVGGSKYNDIALLQLDKKAM